MDWQPMDKYKSGPALFYYPAITGNRHTSNNRPAEYSTERWYTRKPTMFVAITPPT